MVKIFVNKTQILLVVAKESHCNIYTITNTVELTYIRTDIHTYIFVYIGQTKLNITYLETLIFVN